MMMLNDDDVTNRGYKLHCLDMMLTELKHEVEGCKELILYHKILSHDFREISKHMGKTKGMFLMKTYNEDVMPGEKHS